MRFLILQLTLAGVTFAQPLPGTQPLDMQGDLASTMVEGIVKHLRTATDASKADRHPTRERLAKILGVVHARVPFEAPRRLGPTAVPAMVAETKQYRVYAVSWPVLGGVTAEGLLYQPNGVVRARVIAVPDADATPEGFVV